MDEDETNKYANEETYKKLRQRKQKRDWARCRRKREKEIFRQLVKENKDLEEYNTQLKQDVDLLRERKLCLMRQASHRRKSVGITCTCHVNSAVVTSTMTSSTYTRQSSAQSRSASCSSSPGKHNSFTLSAIGTSSVSSIECDTIDKDLFEQLFGEGSFEDDGLGFHLSQSSSRSSSSSSSSSRSEDVQIQSFSRSNSGGVILSQSPSSSLLQSQVSITTSYEEEMLPLSQSSEINGESGRLPFSQTSSASVDEDNSHMSFSQPSESSEDISYLSLSQSSYKSDDISSLSTSCPPVKTGTNNQWHLSPPSGDNRHLQRRPLTNTSGKRSIPVPISSVMSSYFQGANTTRLDNVDQVMIKTEDSTTPVYHLARGPTPDISALLKRYDVTTEDDILIPCIPARKQGSAPGPYTGFVKVETTTTPGLR